MGRFLPALLLVATSVAQQRDLSYNNLAEGQSINGFRATAVYEDDDHHAMGARFLHERSGFTLDLLQIQSAPQAFVWVTTFPTSNMGEPHTQEHLLVGKGNKGRALGSEERMSLVTSTAFTMQWRTCYNFYTAAGPDVFFQHFGHDMDALIHPDYSDEEIRREVRNFGVSEDPKDGSLHLEEKGTVYNEMVTSMDQANRRLFQAMNGAIYGPAHPLALSSGGLPADLRVIQASDIRRFHDEHYFLANMGVIASLPKEVSLASALAQFDTALKQVEPDSTAVRRPVMTENQLPAPKPGPAGQIGYVEYPLQNEQQPGTAAMFWPAQLKLNLRERTLLDLFLSNLAGSADTNLYKRLIDSKTRDADFGLRGVFASVDSDQGNPVTVLFQDVPVARMNDRDLGELRTKVLDELARVAAYGDGSPELKQFNQRLKGRIVEERRSLAKLVNSPPGFGFRNGNSAWLETLYDLNREPGFHKTVTSKEDLAAIETLVGGDYNIWRDYLAQWKLLDVVPSMEAAKPNAALVRQAAQEREARAATETARLRQQYGASNDQDALRKYRAEYDAATAVIDKADRNALPPKFLDRPPMTLDDTLDFKSTKLAGGVPLVSSTFQSMTSASTGIALRLDGVPEDRLVYLSLLPGLLTAAGVIENGKAVAYEDMVERLRNEILSLGATFSMNPATGRDELVLQGAGNNAAESKRAVEWMNLALYHPNWRPENLARIRDYVDQALGGLRRTMQGGEENWVRDPANAYWKQDNPLILTTSSFLTRTHNAQRLRWMLKEGGSDAIYAFLTSLGGIQASRDERRAALAAIRAGQYMGMEKLPAQERDLAIEAARDLDASLGDIPDSSLASDWRYLCGEMVHDLRQGPQQTLAILEEVRRSILVTGGARMFVTGSASSQAQLAPGIKMLAAGLKSVPLKKVVYRAGKRVEERLRARVPDATAPVFVGLLNANSQGGVFVNSAPLTGYRDTGRDQLLDYLAVNVYAGGGAHTLFSKTIAAGLAYSNGINAPLNLGRAAYYAERTPELPQTLKFVIATLKAPAPDIPLTDYALAGAFQNTRVASAYEARGEGMAADLADGLTPEVITRFHQAILNVRKSTPNLQAELLRRLSAVDAKVLPGMGVKGKDVPGAVYFAIGPEKQLAAYEEYLKTSDGPDARVWRLYPRDFWLTIP